MKSFVSSEKKFNQALADVKHLLLTSIKPKVSPLLLPSSNEPSSSTIVQHHPGASRKLFTTADEEETAPSLLTESALATLEPVCTNSFTDERGETIYTIMAAGQEHNVFYDVRNSAFAKAIKKFNTKKNQMSMLTLEKPESNDEIEVDYGNLLNMNSLCLLQVG
jgi:hypothetical protein